MFWGYTEVYVLHKIICGPHEENSSPERKKTHSPCHVTVPMIYTKHVNCKYVDDTCLRNNKKNIGEKNVVSLYRKYTVNM